MGRLSNITDEEWQNRVELAACYHLANHFNMSDIIWNHITAKTYSQKDTLLINKFGLRYDEVTASNLLEIDLDGNIINGEGEINQTGYVIHGAIHKNRKDIHCVMHTHSRAGLAVSCFKEGLKPMIQDSAIFYNRISYHEWEGMSTDSEECDRLSKSLGLNNVMILRNHGLLTCGESIAEAFMLMYLALFAGQGSDIEQAISLVDRATQISPELAHDFLYGRVYVDGKYLTGGWIVEFNRLA